MKKMLLLLVATTCSCTAPAQEEIQQNPFFSEWTTPFGVPPFDQIREEHYLPAIKEGMTQQQQEIQAILQGTEAPTFENTIETIESSGAFLTRVNNVFDNMTSAHTNDALQAIAKDVAPLLAKHRDDILLNGERIFLRGISIHEEAIGATPSRAIDDVRARELLSIAKQDLNANFVRLAHYPHTPAMTRMAAREQIEVRAVSHPRLSRPRPESNQRHAVSASRPLIGRGDDPRPH